MPAQKSYRESSVCCAEYMLCCSPKIAAASYIVEMDIFEAEAREKGWFRNLIVSHCNKVLNESSMSLLRCACDSIDSCYAERICLNCQY